MATRPRIVVVGAGFAGHTAARHLLRTLRGAAEITVIDRHDHFLYLPLLPEVAAGTLDPRRIAVPLSRTLRGARLVLGEVDRIDVDARTVGWADPAGGRGETGYDHLILAAGSVNKLLPVPGVATYAHGFRSIGEALYLRDHLIRQVEIAAADPAGREAGCTVVVVGAGYTGTEVAAQGVLLTDALVRDRPELRVRWLLVDLAPRILPELDKRLSAAATRVLRRRGVEIRTGESVAEALPDRVRLTGGDEIPTRTLVWCVGVRPEPLVAGLGLDTDRGRLVVGTDLAVPDHPEILACGDAAAVPDVTRQGVPTAMTAQHATRQGTLAARNVAAALGHGTAERYRHHDLGFVVELGGWDAAANPLGIPLSGPPAAAVTRAYHLLAMPGNRVRVAADWLLGAVTRRQVVQLGLVDEAAVPLQTAPAQQIGPATHDPAHHDTAS